MRYLLFILASYRVTFVLVLTSYLLSGCGQDCSILHSQIGKQQREIESLEAERDSWKNEYFNKTCSIAESE